MERTAGLSLVLGRSSDFLLVVDHEGTVLEANAAIVAALGWDPDDVVGRKCHQLMGARTSDGSIACSPTCPWLARATIASAAGPAEMVATPRPARSMPALEFRLKHIPLTGLEKPIIVLLLEETTQRLRRERIGARLDALRTGDAGVAGSLTRREYEVLRLLCEGLTSIEIAARLGLKPTTVRSHSYRLLSKLQARNRAGALMKFLTEGEGRAGGTHT
jgi:DNA-binding CsgD family transcriptional regulator